MMAVQTIRIRHSTGWGYRTAVTYYNRTSLCCVVLYCTTECCMNTIFKYYMLMSALQTLRRESDSGRRKGSTSYPILSYLIESFCRIIARCVALCFILSSLHVTLSVPVHLILAIRTLTVPVPVPVSVPVLVPVSALVSLRCPELYSALLFGTVLCWMRLMWGRREEDAARGGQPSRTRHDTTWR
jgi:hypothetical protein